MRIPKASQATRRIIKIFEDVRIIRLTPDNDFTAKAFNFTYLIFGLGLGKQVNFDFGALT